MKESSKILFLLVILLVVAVSINPWVVLGIIMFSGFFFPVFLIEAIALVQLFKDFSGLKAIYTALIFYIISVSVSIFVFMFFTKYMKLFIEPFIGVGVISLLLHLFLLKFQLKTNLSIKVVSAFVFAHIVYVICWYSYNYLFPPQAPTITFC